MGNKIYVSLMQDLKLGFRQQVDLDQKVKLWEKNLSRPFPMAPWYLVERGYLCPENRAHVAYYKAECSRFGEFVNNFSIQELNLQCQEHKLGPYHNWNVVHFGVGQGDDLSYLADAVQLGYHPIVYDIATRAIRHGKKRLKTLFVQQEPVDHRFGELVRELNDIVKFGEIGIVCERKDFDPTRTLLYHISRVIHHNSDWHAILVRLCTVMQNRRARLILVHPFPEDNPGYVYTTSQPITQAEILGALSTGGERKFEVHRENTYTYFSIPDADDPDVKRGQVYRVVSIY